MSFFFSLDVLQRFNRKEPGAWSWVYNKHYSAVYSLVRKITAGSADSKDLTAIVFLKLLEYEGRFESLDKIKYFLYTTAKYTSIDYLRQQQVRQEKYDKISRQAVSVEENGLEKAEAKASFQQLITSSIEQLPRRCRYIFMLYYSRGLTNYEIASRLHISEKTVSNQKTIAIKMLKMKIGKINGAPMTLLISLHHYIFHLHHLLRIVRSALG
jgi:RNA polymerase sigma-70 factor (ECF subfamily)